MIVWQYDVHPAARKEFEQAYGPGGAWATLFRASRDYLGTQLLHDAGLSDRYITLDYWQTENAFAQFMKDHRAEYDALDQLCEPFTAAEMRLGDFWCTAKK